jgi:hypothetical protein
MQELIPINYDNPERPTVDGRELHEQHFPVTEQEYNRLNVWNKEE